MTSSKVYTSRVVIATVHQILSVTHCFLKTKVVTRKPLRTCVLGELFLNNKAEV